MQEKTGNQMVRCGEAGCGAPMVLRTAKSGPFAGKPFYGCSRFPACRGTHGAHPDGKPLGRPADAATKEARHRTHAAFDRVWQEGFVAKRKIAYRWMRSAMELPEAEAHISMMDIVTCNELVRVVDAFIARSATMLGASPVVRRSELRAAPLEQHGSSPSSDAARAR